MMGRKVGIITLYGLHNYGNRLQNYATQTILVSLGCEVRTLRLRRRYVLGASAETLRSVSCAMRRDVQSHRRRNFRDFDRLIRKAHFVSRRHLRRARDGYLCYVVGSDQVWNPYYDDLAGNEFLDWAYEWQRIALAPSFGVEQIPGELQRSFADGLSGFESLSVREHAGADLILELTGHEAAVLIDPTMLLTADQWRNVARPSARPHTPYVLTYFLGETSGERRVAIADFAAQHSLVLIELMDRENPDIYSSGPSEFIDLINNATCVLTDSFHGSAFSLLLDTPVTIFDREGGEHSMLSRIDTFAKMFGLERHRYSEYGFESALSTEGYATAHESLVYERERFMNYLREALARAEAGRAHELNDGKSRHSNT